VDLADLVPFELDADPLDVTQREDGRFGLSRPGGLRRIQSQ
jgi:hypothetical protein